MSRSHRTPVMPPRRMKQNGRIQAARSSGYLALCYHYIRQRRSIDPFPKILGNPIDEFKRHLKMLKSRYQIISLAEAREHSYSDVQLNTARLGMLLTFDDGLSDHYVAAEILFQYGIKAVFFIPTCILMDRLPANPTIVHYALAIRRIDGFLKVYREALEFHKLDVARFDIKFKKGESDPWRTIGDIKATLKYRLDNADTRRVLLYIYYHSILKDYPDILKIMHLAPEQVHEMLKMGHSIGVHSHSHISVAATKLSAADFDKEIVAPKKYLESTFHVPVNAFSYPFGEQRDCLKSESLINRTKEYDLAFTVEKKINTKDTSPFELGRYMPHSTDNDLRLKATLEAIK